MIKKQALIATVLVFLSAGALSADRAQAAESSNGEDSSKSCSIEWDGCSHLRGAYAQVVAAELQLVEATPDSLGDLSTAAADAETMRSDIYTGLQKASCNMVGADDNAKSVSIPISEVLNNSDVLHRCPHRAIAKFLIQSASHNLKVAPWIFDGYRAEAYETSLKLIQTLDTDISGDHCN